MKISAKNETPAIKVEAASWSASGDFSMDEDVYANSDPDYQIACHGKFVNGGSAPVLTASGGFLESHFQVQSGTAFKIGPVTGTHCQDLWAWRPFWPISKLSPDSSVSPQRYVEEMLTGPFKVGVSQLRHMNVGDVLGLTNHYGLRTPPESCDFLATGGQTCTESLDFTGHMKIQRTR